MDNSSDTAASLQEHSTASSSDLDPTPTVISKEETLGVTLAAEKPLLRSVTEDPFLNPKAISKNPYGKHAESCGKSLDPCGNPGGFHDNPGGFPGNPPGLHENPSFPYGNPFGFNGNPSESFGNPTESYGNPLESPGNPSNPHGYKILEAPTGGTRSLASEVLEKARNRFDTFWRRNSKDSKDENI